MYHTWIVCSMLEGPYFLVNHKCLMAADCRNDKHDQLFVLVAPRWFESHCLGVAASKITVLSLLDLLKEVYQMRQAAGRNIYIIQSAKPSTKIGHVALDCMKGFISAVTCTQRSSSSVHQLIASSVHQDIIISSSMTYHSFPPFLFQLKNPASRLYKSSILIIIPHWEERSFNSKGSLTHCFAAPGWPNMDEHGDLPWFTEAFSPNG